MPQDFDGIDWDAYYGGADEQDQARRNHGKVEAGMVEQDEAEEQEVGHDPDHIIYKYTDCNGEGDTLLFHCSIFNDNAALTVSVNDGDMVILRDEQVNDLIGKLLAWQDERDERE